MLKKKKPFKFVQLVLRVPLLDKSLAGPSMTLGMKTEK